MDLPHLMAQSWRVLWDQENSRLLYWLPTLQSYSADEVVQVAVQSKNGAMQMTGITVVEKKSGCRQPKFQFLFGDSIGEI